MLAEGMPSVRCSAAMMEKMAFLARSRRLRHTLVRLTAQPGTRRILLGAGTAFVAPEQRRRELWQQT
jgi:hypothetical protein